MCTAPPQKHLLFDSMMMPCLEWGVLESAQINPPLQLLGHSQTLLSGHSTAQVGPRPVLYLLPF